MAGRKTQPTDEERATIVALYREHGNADAVVERQKYGERVVLRVLHESGVPIKSGRRIPPEDEDRVREVMRPLWTGGAPLKGVAAATGYPGISDTTIRRLMRGVPRKKPMATLRHLVPTPMSDDPEGWIWFAGVFEAKGHIVRRSGGAVSAIRVNHASEGFVLAIVRTLGVGNVGSAHFSFARKAVGSGGVTSREQNSRWVVSSLVDIHEVLRRIEPHLRWRQNEIRRVVEETGASVRERTP